MRNIVNGLLVRQDAVLLARRSPHRKSYGGMWSFPGGHVEANETLLAALARELVEEIGVTPTATASLGSIVDPNSGTDEPITYHMFKVSAWAGGDPRMRGFEHAEIAWFTPQNACSLPDLALAEYKALIKDLGCA